MEPYFICLPFPNLLRIRFYVSKSVNNMVNLTLTGRFSERNVFNLFYCICFGLDLKISIQPIRSGPFGMYEIVIFS